MKLDGLYEFSELTQIEGIFVSRGREKASGKLIQIHLFPAGKSEDANRICQQLISMPDEARTRILKYGQEGSASYFVTEPLPNGENLQSWVARLGSPGQSPSAPQVSLGLTDQLRQLGISPAPLAPMMPGPESYRKAQNKGPAETAAARVLPSSEPLAPPGELTREFRSVYGEGQADSEFAPGDIHNEPSPEPLTPNKAPGLDTFLGFHPAFPPEATKTSPPVSVTGESPRPQPVIPLERSPAAGGSSLTDEFDVLYRERRADDEFAPSGFREEPRPDNLAGLRLAAPRVIRPPLARQPDALFEPAPSPLPVPDRRQAPVVVKPMAEKGKPRSSPGILDLKTVVLVVAVLLAVAALVIAIVETSG